MKPCNYYLLAQMLTLAVGGVLTNQAAIADTANDRGFLQCFYECKRNPTGQSFTEQTTLMIMNGDQTPVPVGSHTTTRVAHLAFINGNERIIARSEVRLSPRDLDEVNVCATLLPTPGGPPPAGIVQVAIGAPTAPGQFVPARDVDIAIKNPVGIMSLTNPEVFQGRITGVGKTSCFEIEDEPQRLVFDPQFQQAPVLNPVLIERTADPDTPGTP